MAASVFIQDILTYLKSLSSEAPMGSSVSI